MYGYNPMGVTSPMLTYPQQRQEIVRVNGENGARAYQLPPSSSALLLDETNPVVWLVQTDGAGYKTISAYEISPKTTQDTTISDYSKLEERIKRLEDMLNESDNKRNGT